jgi:hypothetical protein
MWGATHEQHLVLSDWSIFLTVLSALCLRVPCRGVLSTRALAEQTVRSMVLAEGSVSLRAGATVSSLVFAEGGQRVAGGCCCCRRRCCRRRRCSTCCCGRDVFLWQLLPAACLLNRSCPAQRPTLICLQLPR